MASRLFAFAFVLASASSARAEVKIGELVMDNHDEGHIIYADRCSNGNNNDQAGFDRFVTALRADPRSKLSLVLAEAQRMFVTDKTLYEIALGDWVQTYHLRMGCAENSNSHSAFVFLRSKMSNMHELVTKYVITIDDDVASERRKLRVRSVVPLALRDQ
jgi:hypothetical protein